ncbi:MAG: hypothetical protein E7055_09200 [Lentisphaerae bacterium]|nr:hypothetical protein [Lentisphaerota bacterium]
MILKLARKIPVNLKKLFAAGLFCGVVGMVSSAENLIRNPEFELSTGSGFPKGWRLNKNAFGEVVPGPDGKNAISLTGPEAGKFYHWTQPGIRIEAGKTYLLKGKFKADAGSQVSIYLECNSPWRTHSTGPLNGNGIWQNFSVKNISFKKLDKPPYLVCRLKAPGTMLITGLELMESTPGEINLIRNNDFTETGTDGQPKGWSIRKGANASFEEDKDGKYLKLACPPDGKIALVLQHGIQLKPNQEYVFSALVKGSADSGFSAYLESSKPVWQTHASPWWNGTEKWQNLSFRFKFREFKLQPYLGLRAKGKGEVLIKKPSVKPVAGGLVNGDFSAGTQAWEISHGKVIDLGKSAGKILELNSSDESAQARQTGIRVEKGRFYELRYQVSGGSDKTHRDSQNAVWFRGSVMMNGKPLTKDTWRDCFNAWQKKSTVFKAPANGTVTIVLEAKKPYCVDFDNVELTVVKQPVPPLVILPNPPFTFRNGVYSANRQCRKGKYSIVNNTVQQATAYKIDFNRKQFTIPMQSSAVFELEIPSDAGIYPIRVEALDAAGKSLASATLPLQVNRPAQREVTFRADRVMLINGKPFFPLGVWSIKGKKSNWEKAKLISEAGFNTARTDDDTMDDFAEHGMMVLLSVPEKLPQFKSAAQFARWDQRYRRAMAKNQVHPSLIGYYNCDEPAWRGISSRQLLEAYKYLRKIDPYRPIMLNEAPRGKISDIRPYAAAGDIYGVDIYPVPEPNAHSGLSDKNITAVGKYVDICRQVVYDRKPIWMTLQAFAWGAVTKKPLVYPTEHQTRFMAYNAVAHGATGLFWWGINNGNCENWEFVRQLGKTIWELRKMSAVFVAETVQPAMSKASAPEVNILHKRLDGIDWYIAVNESKKNLMVDFSHAGEKPLNVFFENRKIVPASGHFQDSFKAYDVHIYSSAGKLPPELKIPTTRRMTAALNLPDDYRNANWIWYPGKSRVKDHRAYFKREITLDAVPDEALIFCTADDYFRMYVNGRLFMEHYKSRSWNNISFRDTAKFLQKGKNTILIKAMDGGGAPCGLLYSAVIREKNGKVLKILSDTKTQASEDNRNWVDAEIVCPFGGSPWSTMGPPCPAEVDMLNAYGFPF